MSQCRWQTTPPPEADEEPKAEKKAEEPKKEEPKKQAVDESAAKIKKLEEQNAELKKELAYVQADAQNARRIGREDTEKAKNFAVTGFAKDMIEVADTLDRAIEALNKLPADLVPAEDKSFKNVLTGVKMCDSVLMSAFNKHSISKVEVKPGTEFDCNVHEALFNAPATEEIGAGKITAVIKTGYTIKERVLRAAQVGVAEKQ